MKNATRLLVPSLSLGLLVKSIAIGHALAFTLYVDSDPSIPVPAGTNDYATVGAVTGPNSTPGFGAYTNVLGPSPIESYSTPSVVNFGVTQTFGTAGSDAAANTAAYNGGASSTVSFNFDLQNGVAPGSASVPSAADGAFSRFVVTGSLLGSVGYPAPHAGNSTTNIIFSSVTEFGRGRRASDLYADDKSE